MSAQLKPRYTLEEYFALELASEAKYEYWEGQVFVMSGASEAHDSIQSNLHFGLRLKLHGRQCRVFLSEMRLKVPSFPPYRYPDLSALCGKPVFEKIGGLDVLTNPALIVEVLSSSTEAFDRGDKFAYYKSIPGFCEYVLVAQQRRHVVQYAKQGDSAWLQREFSEMTDTIHLASLDIEVTLNDIYEGVTFPAANPYRLLSNPEQKL